MAVNKKMVSLRIAIVLGSILVATSSLGSRSYQACQLDKHNSKKFGRAARVHKVADHYMDTNPKLWKSLATYMAESTVAASEEFKVPLKIVVGVNTKESTADPFARSRTGAIGTSQVDFVANAERFPDVKTTRDRYDPSQNIRCGTSMLQEYIKKYGVSNALQVYNLGEGAYKKGKRNTKYVKDVLKYAQKFESSS